MRDDIARTNCFTTPKEIANATLNLNSIPKTVSRVKVIMQDPHVTVSYHLGAKLI